MSQSRDPSERLGAEPDREASAPEGSAKPPGSPWKKILLLVVVVAAAVTLYVKFGDVLTLENLAEKETELRALRDSHPLAVYGGAFLIYVTMTGLSLPGAAILSLVFAWFFGFWRGTLLVSFASTTGATIAFLMSRYLLRDTIRSRFGDRLESFDEALKREGAFYLFTLRLLPAVPFFIINLVMGLTHIKTRTFWWVSQVGMLPGTMAFVYAGSSVPDFATLAEKGARGILSPQLIAAFVILGFLPLFLKKGMAKLREAQGKDEDSESTSPASS